MKNTRLDLFFTFMKIGAFTFGGGYAMIPLIQREAGENRRWINEDELMEIVAIAESTPGPIAVNAATFIGRKTAGFWGAVCATLGVVLPSFLIIFALSAALQAFRSLRIVAYAFFGVRAGVLALIARALITLLRKCPRDPAAYLTMAAAFLAITCLRISAVTVVLCCALLGAGAALLSRRAAKP